MKVVVTVGGQFHAFELARQLENRGCLERLITGYPLREVRRSGLPSGKIISLPLGQLLYRGWRRLPTPIRGLADPVYRASELFDRQASRRLPGAHLLIGWSSFSLHTLREAKRRGMKTVLERGSSHILFQRQILTEEYERIGCRGDLPHPALVEKELREYAETDYIEVPSSFVRESFVRQGVPGEKIIQGFRGVDLAQFRQISRDDSVFRVIFAGRICIRKGIQYLLRAFSELALPESELLLIGSIADEAKPILKRYRKRIICLGSRPRAELYRYFSRGNVFVLPSLEEGLAVVQLQAMACGLPLICTPHTGGGDVIENGNEGFIIPIRDVEALKEKLLLLYRDPNLQKEMGERAKRKVRLGFSWDDYGDRMIGEYRRVIEKNDR